MKKWFLVILQAISMYAIHAQVKWDGEAGDGAWDNPLNWFGDELPAAGSSILLDNSILSGDYMVILPAGNTSTVVNSLMISPAGGATIQFINPVVNTSTTAFVATAGGDAIVINTGAIFINASGASSGTPVSVTAAGIFRINNGGRYIHRTARGHTDFLASRLSTAAGTENGIFEFDVPGTASYTVSGSNRTYGTLQFSTNAAAAARTYTSSGTGTFRINGNLILDHNAVFSYGANTNTIIIQGDCTIRTGAVFNISNGANNSLISIKGNLVNEGIITETGSSTNSTLELNGVTTQTVSSTGSILQSIQFSINNPAGMVLLTDLSLSYRLQLLHGKIRGQASQSVILNDNATCTGGSTESFVETILIKIGDDNFIFPVGKGSIYAPIAMAGTGDVNDAFAAEYIRSNPQTTPGLGNLFQSPIHHISYVEYWKLERKSGISSKTVQLFLGPSSFALHLNTLRVARHQSGTWMDGGGQNFQLSTPAPPYVTGSFYSSTEISDFGYFTIGTTDIHTDNPLPVQLLTVNAHAENDLRSSIRWTMSNEDQLGTHFEIWRSANGIQFEKIGVCKGRMTREYQFIDQHAMPGMNYYQIRIVDSSGEINNSKTMTVLHRNQGVFLKAMLSNIVREKLTIGIYTGKKQEWDFVIIDAMGRVCRRQKIQAGSDLTNFDIKRIVLLLPYTLTAVRLLAVIHCWVRAICLRKCSSSSFC